MGTPGYDWHYYYFFITIIFIFTAIIITDFALLASWECV